MIKVSSLFKRSVMPLIVTMVTHSEVFPLHTGQLCHYVLLDASRPGAKLEKVWRYYYIEIRPGYYVLCRGSIKIKICFHVKNGITDLSGPAKKLLKVKISFCPSFSKWKKKLKEPNVEKCHIKNFLLQFFPFFESKVLKPFFCTFLKSVKRFQRN